MFNQTALSCREILIALVPIGNISNEKFAKFSRYVRRQCVAELKENANFLSKGNKLPRRSWERDKLYFNFEYAENIQRSDWEEMQLHKKIFGLIGIVDCSAEDTLDGMHEKFAAKTATLMEPPADDNKAWGNRLREWREASNKTHSDVARMILNKKKPKYSSSEIANFEKGEFSSPEMFEDIKTFLRAQDTISLTLHPSKANYSLIPWSIPRMCLAFQPRADQLEKNVDFLKIIPDQDDEHIYFYVKQLILLDIVDPLLTKFNIMFEKLQSTLEMVEKNPDITLYSTIGDDTPTENLSQSKRKKRMLARTRKHFGDIALLAGSPADAIDLYAQSIEQSKATFDWEWAAAALEGYCSARLTLGPMDPNDDISKDVVDKLQISASYYINNPKAEILLVETLLKLAKFMAVIPDKKIEATEVLMKIVSLLNNMSTQDKIQVCNEIAQTFKLLKMERKYSFFMREAALLCSDILPYTKTHHILSKLAKYYQIDIDVGNSSSNKNDQAENKPALSSRYSLVAEAGVKWVKLQSSIMSSLISLANQMGDTPQTVKYLMYMLREIVPSERIWSLWYPNLLESQSKSSTSKASTSRTSQPPRVSDSEWLSQLKSLQLAPLFLRPNVGKLHGNPGLVISARPIIDETVYTKLSKGVNDPLFLYRPRRFTKQGMEKDAEPPTAYAWPGKLVYFEVALTNPFSETLQLHGVSIVLKPVIVQTDERGRAKVSVAEDIQIRGKDEGPSASVNLRPTQKTLVRLSMTIPTISNLPEPQPGTSLLLVPNEVKYTLFNCRISEIAVPIETSSVQLLVSRSLRLLQHVPTLTILEPRHAWNANSEKHELAKLDKTPNVARDVFVGEEFATTLVLTNEDSITSIDDVAFEVLENDVTVFSSLSTYVDENDAKPSSEELKVAIESMWHAIQKGLPLQPQQSLAVPLSFVISPECRSLTVRVEYRNTAGPTNIWRKAQWSLMLHLQPGLRMSRVRAFRSTRAVVPALLGDSDILQTHKDSNSTKLLVHYEVNNPTEHTFNLFRDEKESENGILCYKRSTTRVWTVFQFNEILSLLEEIRKDSGLDSTEEELCKKAMLRISKLRWKSAGSSGVLRVNEKAIDMSTVLSALRPTMATIAMSLKGSTQVIIPEKSSKDWPRDIPTLRKGLLHFKQTKGLTWSEIAIQLSLSDAGTDNTQWSTQAAIWNHPNTAVAVHQMLTKEYPEGIDGIWSPGQTSTNTAIQIKCQTVQTLNVNIKFDTTAMQWISDVSLNRPSTPLRTRSKRIARKAPANASPAPKQILRPSFYLTVLCVSESQPRGTNYISWIGKHNKIELSPMPKPSPNGSAEKDGNADVENGASDTANGTTTQEHEITKVVKFCIHEPGEYRFAAVCVEKNTNEEYWMDLTVQATL